MVTKKQLLYELMCAATQGGVSVKDFGLDDPVGMGSGPTISAKAKVCGVKTKLFYGQAGDNMALWLAHGVKCIDVAAATAATDAYEQTSLGQKFCVENEVNGEEDGLLLSHSFPNGSEDENIAALQEIFSLFSDSASSEKLAALMRYFA